MLLPGWPGWPLPVAMPEDRETTYFKSGLLCSFVEIWRQKLLGRSSVDATKAGDDGRT